MGKAWKLTGKAWKVRERHEKARERYENSREMHEKAQILQTLGDPKILTMAYGLQNIRKTYETEQMKMWTN